MQEKKQVCCFFVVVNKTILFGIQILRSRLADFRFCHLNPTGASKLEFGSKENYANESQLNANTSQKDDRIWNVCDF